MENKRSTISVNELTKKIAALIKEDIVAVYKDEDEALEMKFLNGQKFRIFVEEIQ